MNLSSSFKRLLLSAHYMSRPASDGAAVSAGVLYIFPSLIQVQFNNRTVSQCNGDTDPALCCDPVCLHFLPVYPSDASVLCVVQ